LCIEGKERRQKSSKGGNRKIKKGYTGLKQLRSSIEDVFGRTQEADLPKAKEGVRQKGQRRNNYPTKPIHYGQDEKGWIKRKKEQLRDRK